MPRKYAPKTYNIDLYKKRMRELGSVATTDAKPEDYLVRIGAVTTLFEACEAMLYGSILPTLTTDRPLLRSMLTKVNSRATRVQLIEEFLEDHKPSRLTKRYRAVCDLFERYSVAGSRRDEVAHATLGDWDWQGRRILILEPAWTAERKRVAGIPKWHYDIPKMDALIADLEALWNDQLDLMKSVATAHVKRLKQRPAKAD